MLIRFCFLLLSCNLFYVSVIQIFLLRLTFDFLLTLVCVCVCYSWFSCFYWFVFDSWFLRFTYLALLLIFVGRFFRFVRCSWFSCFSWFFALLYFIAKRLIGGLFSILCKLCCNWSDTIYQEDEEFHCKNCDKRRSHNSRTTVEESHSDMDTE